MVALKFGEKLGGEGGGELLSWVGVYIGVVYGEASIWVWRLLAKILDSRLGWVIGRNSSKIGVLGINLFN